MKYVLVILCVAMLALCVVVIFYPKDEIIKVELARSGAWADRGAAISVNDSLRYNFYYTYTNSEKKPLTGYFIGTARRALWDSLCTKLDNIDFKTVRSDSATRSDAQYYELIVTWKNQKQRVVRQMIYNPKDPVANVLSWLDHSYKRVHFDAQVDKPFKFETTFQNPPAIRIDQVQFPPPVEQKKGK